MGGHGLASVMQSVCCVRESTTASGIQILVLIDQESSSWGSARGSARSTDGSGCGSKLQGRWRELAEAGEPALKLTIRLAQHVEQRRLEHHTDDRHEEEDDGHHVFSELGRRQ